MCDAGEAVLVLRTLWRECFSRGSGYDVYVVGSFRYLLHNPKSPLLHQLFSRFFPGFSIYRHFRVSYSLWIVHAWLLSFYVA